MKLFQLECFCLVFTRKLFQPLGRGIEAAGTVTHTGGAGRKHGCKSYGSGMTGAGKDVPAQGDRAALCLCVKHNTQIHHESLTERQSRN